MKKIDIKKITQNAMEKNEILNNCKYIVEYKYCRCPFIKVREKYNIKEPTLEILYDTEYFKKNFQGKATYRDFDNFIFYYSKKTKTLHYTIDDND